MQRATLALLLVQAGQPVPLHEIIGVLWGEAPPDTAANMVQRYIRALRRMLEPELTSRSASRRLVRGSGGYRLVAGADELDLLRFRELRRQAEGDTEEREKAAELLLEALALWQGPVADGVAFEIRSHPLFATVDGEHLAAIKTAAGHALGASPELADRVLVEVRRFAARHPLDEVLQARLMLLLAAGGRQAEALEVFGRAREALAEQLGLQPGGELRSAHLTILRQVDAAPAPITSPVRPEQLPADLMVFAGRGQELDDLHRLAEGPASLLTIGGMGGVGKTTLAVHFAHEVAARFPDGRLYLDLRGFHPDGTVVAPIDALQSLLEGLGVPSQRIPATLDTRAALFRSMLAGRRALIVLDNARDSEHVLPLLPGTPGCLTVVTSRHQLYDLVTAHGAAAVTLDPLPYADATALLARRLGEDRVTLEAEAVAEIVEHTGRLPLALAMVGARAAINPGFSLAAIAEELRQLRGSLDAFVGENPRTDARSVFDWSYRILRAPAARLFRLLSVHPGAECSRAAAVALTGQTGPETRRQLAELLRAHLVTEPAPGRYASHDLLRAYATEMAAQEADDDLVGARRRLLDHYLHSAYAAVHTLVAGREPLTLDPAVDGAAPLDFATPAEAAAWLEREYPAMVAVIGQDGADGLDRRRWQIAATLDPYLDRSGRWAAQRAAQTAALRVAARTGDPYAAAYAERSLGFAEVRAGRAALAEPRLQRALRLFEESGNRNAAARTRRLIAFNANGQGRHDVALEHYRTAADIYRETGFTSGAMYVHNEAGWTYILMGEPDRALEPCRRAIAGHRVIGHRNGEAGAWDSLGVALHQLGDADAAVEAFGHALQLYRELAEAYLEADTLVHLGDAQLAAGRSGEAAAAWRDALEILDRLEHPEAAQVREKVHALGVRPAVSRGA